MAGTMIHQEPNNAPTTASITPATAMNAEKATAYTFNTKR
jgi:hypothetical protein